MKPDKELDVLNILTNIHIFQGFGNQELRKIIPLLKPVTYPSDTLIIKQGARGDSMFVIKKGTVKVTRVDENNEEVSLGNLYAGTYFGELSLIDDLPRSANVTSIEETEIFQLNKNVFDKLLFDNIQLANMFYMNCLKETFSRFRNIIANFTFSQHNLKTKSALLDEIDRDLSLAKKVQGYFINTEYLESEGLRNGIKHSYIYHPCIAIGGDFINVVELKNDLIGMIIADVEGHGITAALATGVLKSGFSIKYNELGDKPIELMKFLNRHFNELLPQLYATCYYSIIDPKRNKILFAKAGHHHPLFWRESKKDFVEIDCIGTGLGLILDAKFGQIEFDIEPGDKVLFYTDGIIEQINDKIEMYQMKRLADKFKSLIHEGEKEIVEKLFQDLKDFSNETPFEDDITLILFEF